MTIILQICKWIKYYWQSIVFSNALSLPPPPAPPNYSYYVMASLTSVTHYTHTVTWHPISHVTYLYQLTRLGQNGGSLSHCHLIARRSVAVVFSLGIDHTKIIKLFFRQTGSNLCLVSSGRLSDCLSVCKSICLSLSV